MSGGDEKEDELLDKLIASSPSKSPVSTTMIMPESDVFKYDELDNSMTAATPENIISTPKISSNVKLDAKGASDFDFTALESQMKGVELPPILPRLDTV